MDEEEFKRFIENEIGINTYFFLKNYRAFNTEARVIQINLLLDLYKQIKGKEGKFSNLSDDSIKKLKALISLEMLSKCMMAVEDFGSFLWAFSKNDIKKLAENFIKCPPREAYKTYSDFISKDNSFFFDLLTYTDVDKLHLGPEDKEFLLTIYKSNIDVLKKVLEKTKKFVEYHKIPYNKYKHGMPIVFGIKAQDIESQIDSIIPVMHENVLKSRFVLEGDLPNERYFRLAKSIALVFGDIIDAKIHMAESNGFKKVIWATFFRVTKEEKERLDKIHYAVSKDAVRNRVALQLKLELDRKAAQEMLDFLKEEWGFDRFEDYMQDRKDGQLT